MNAPNDRRYIQSHEWFKQEGDLVTVGITQFAADELTDITFVALPTIGKRFRTGDVFGEVESVKATSELYTGIAGEVVAINTDLNDHPEYVNDDAFQRGWMMKLRPESMDQINGLMDAAAYTAKVGG